MQAEITLSVQQAQADAGNMAAEATADNYEEYVPNCRCSFPLSPCRYITQLRKNYNATLKSYAEQTAALRNRVGDLVKVRRTKHETRLLYFMNSTHNSARATMEQTSKFNYKSIAEFCFRKWKRSMFNWRYAAKLFFFFFYNFFQLDFANHLQKIDWGIG